MDSLKVRNEIDRLILDCFNELKEDYGLNELYSKEVTDEEVIKKMVIVFKYFKAGFLTGNIHR